jgi:tetratricopeptide (TPR) repeat protein
VVDGVNVLPEVRHPRPAEVEGIECVPPVLGMLLQFVAERWDGTLLVHDERDAPIGALRIDDGFVVAARVEHVAGGLADKVLELCERVAAQFILAQGADVVGGGAGVVTGRLDPLRLTAALRGHVRYALVERVIAELERTPFKLAPQLDLARYGFDSSELRALAALESDPLSWAELRERADVSDAVLRRLLYVLFVTRALTLFPQRRRIVSGAVMRVPAQPKPARGDQDPTVIVDLGATARMSDMRRQSGAAPIAQVQAEACETAEDAVKRLRCADPGASSAPLTKRYHLQNPEHGTTEARTVPPRRADRPVTSNPPPENADAAAHFRLAEQLLERGNYRGAVFEAQKAMRLCPPRPEQRALYAWVLYLRSGGTPRDVHPHVWAHLQQALESDPACARARYYKGVVLARAGRRTEALAELERASELAPGDQDTERALRLLRAGKHP